jgi:hypothetical protein
MTYSDASTFGPKVYEDMERLTSEVRRLTSDAHVLTRSLAQSAQIGRNLIAGVR